MAAAEQLYLKAKKPELIVKAYTDARMWNEAMRLCKEYLPHKLSEVQMACAQYMSSGQQEGSEGQPSPADLMANARVWEENKQYSEAIDAYLKITKETTNNFDHMEEAWEKATHLAMSYVSDRVPEVVGTVSQRLMEIKRPEQAAELYEGIGRYKDAIDIYVQAGMWDKARSLCANMSPEYADEVEQQYIHRLKSENRVDELLESGQGQSVEAGLEALARMKQWDRVYETCQKQNRADVLQKYQRMHLEQLAGDGGYEEALGCLAKYGAPPEPTHLPLYPKIAMAAMGNGNEASVTQLKDVLGKIIQVLKVTTPPCKPASAHPGARPAHSAAA